MESLLNHLATYQVPHAFFTHFYIVSVMSSLFWGVQILVRGAAVRALASYSLSKSPDKSMTMEQVFLTWSLMALQGVRRLYESITLVKPSSAKMWFVHWFVGIGFYLAVGVAVWIEGVGTSYQETFAFSYGVTLEETAQTAISGAPGESERIPEALQKASRLLASFGGRRQVHADPMHYRNCRVSHAGTR